MKNLLEKIKSYKESLFLIAVIVMVGLIGFGLGRLSAKYQTAELKIQSTLINTADLSKIVTSPGGETNVAAGSGSPPAAEKREVAGPTRDQNRKVVGNKNSKIYHYEDCSGALRMNEGNKVFFASIIDARNAGFRPAGNCPGLE